MVLLLFVFFVGFGVYSTTCYYEEDCIRICCQISSLLEGSSSFTPFVTQGCCLLKFQVSFWFWGMGIHCSLLFFGRSFGYFSLHTKGTPCSAPPLYDEGEFLFRILIRIFPSSFLVFMTLFYCSFTFLPSFGDGGGSLLSIFRRCWVYTYFVF